MSLCTLYIKMLKIKKKVLEHGYRTWRTLCCILLAKKTVVEPPPAKECLLQVFNLVNGDAVSVEITGHNIFPDKIESYKVRSSCLKIH